MQASQTGQCQSGNLQDRRAGLGCHRHSKLWAGQHRAGRAVRGHGCLYEQRAHWASTAGLCGNLGADLDLHGQGPRHCRLDRRFRLLVGQWGQAALGHGADQRQALLVAYAAGIAQGAGPLWAAAPLWGLVRPAIAAGHAAGAPCAACKHTQTCSDFADSLLVLPQMLAAESVQNREQVTMQNRLQPEIEHSHAALTASVWHIGIMKR